MSKIKSNSKRSLKNVKLGALVKELHKREKNKKLKSLKKELLHGRMEYKEGAEGLPSKKRLKAIVRNSELMPQVNELEAIVTVQKEEQEKNLEKAIEVPKSVVVLRSKQFAVNHYNRDLEELATLLFQFEKHLMDVIIAREPYSEKNKKLEKDTSEVKFNMVL